MGPPPPRIKRLANQSKESFTIKTNKTSSTLKIQVSKESSSQESLLRILDDKTQALLRHKGYSIGNKLGSGAFGEVYKSSIRDGTFSAVKILDYKKMSVIYQDRFLLREIEALIQAKHPNVIEVYDIFRASELLFIFMEYAGAGDIAGAVKRAGPSGLGVKQAGVWFLQLVNGLNYFHNELKMCHRDIKLDNFLLNDDQKAKLSDFGFAKVIADDATITPILSQTCCGTLIYEPPQLLERKPYNGFKYDVWSMGVSLYIMLASRLPFHLKTATNQTDTSNMLREQYDYPNYISSKMDENQIPSRAKELLLKMLNPDEDARPLINLVACNAWLQKVGQP